MFVKCQKKTLSKDHVWRVPKVLHLTKTLFDECLALGKDLVNAILLQYILVEIVHARGRVRILVYVSMRLLVIYWGLPDRLLNYTILST